MIRLCALLHNIKFLPISPIILWHIYQPRPQALYSFQYRYVYYIHVPMKSWYIVGLGNKVN